MFVDEVRDVLARHELDGALLAVALGAKAEDRLPWTALREWEAMGDDLLVHPVKHGLGGRAADAVVDVCGEDDVAKTMA
jgi:hypothetical protein